MLPEATEEEEDDDDDDDEETEDESSANEDDDTEPEEASSANNNNQKDTNMINELSTDHMIVSNENVLVDSNHLISNIEKNPITESTVIISSQIMDNANLNEQQQQQQQQQHSNVNINSYINIDSTESNQTASTNNESLILPSAL